MMPLLYGSAEDAVVYLGNPPTNPQSPLRLTMPLLPSKEYARTKYHLRK